MEEGADLVETDLAAVEVVEVEAMEEAVTLVALEEGGRKAAGWRR